MYYTFKVIKKLGVENLSSYVIFYTLDLISRESNENFLINIECFSFFGKSLVDKYIFLLYIDDNKLNNEKLSLSQWKKKNNNIFEHLYESDVCVSIGGNILDLLTTSSINMIEFKTLYNDEGKLNHIIKIVDSVRKIIITNNKVLTVPTKLPIITKPKPYILEANGDITLGGYLNNDILFIIELFIPKIGYRDTTKIMEKNNVIDLINGVSSVPYKINTETLEKEVDLTLFI